MEPLQKRVSVITPTHDTKFLVEAWESLKKQTSDNWEWVLVPNGSAIIPPEILNDPRVKTHRFEGVAKGVGQLKKFACEQAAGSIIVEFDHDDMLMPTAIEECIKAFDADPTITFAYSNSVEFRDGTWEPFTYGAQYGWQYRPFTYDGHELQEAIAFKPSPHSISYIYFAPNHFRAWTKEAYNRIGGHNEDMVVIDDHDLMCRMYLDGKMFHIDLPLYLYRVHKTNTWLEKNALVQSETRRTYGKYIYLMFEKWADEKGLLKIDLGAHRGGNGPKHYKSVDIRPGCDYEMDLNGRWNFEDNSVGVIRAFDTFEHLKDKVHVMNEAHRVLAPGGVLLLMIPSSDGRGAFQDPTHISFWNENTLWYFTKKQYADFVPEIKCRFQALRNTTYFPSEFHKKNDISYVIAELVAIKEGYDRPIDHIPALLEI